MNWRLLLFFTPIGFIMGIFKAMAISNSWMVILWFLCCFMIAYFMAKYVPKKWFINVIAIGIVWGICYQISVSVLIETPASYNKGNNHSIHKISSIQHSHWALILGPISGFVTGVLIAIFTWITRRFVPVKKS